MVDPAPAGSSRKRMDCHGGGRYGSLRKEKTNHDLETCECFFFFRLDEDYTETYISKCLVCISSGLDHWIPWPLLCPRSWT